MHHIYCISGLGADHRIFQNLKIANAEMHFIKWTRPAPGDDLHNYAIRLAQQIKHEQIILMGVSFGGMLTTEIAEYFAHKNGDGSNRVDVQKAIVISSCKCPEEFPGPMKWTGKLNLHKLAPYKLILGNDKFNRIVFDLRSKEEELYLKRKMLHDNDLDFLKHAIHMIMKWKKPFKRLPNLVHIHGNADRLLSPKNVKADHWIEDGGHFMVWNKADEVSRIINRLLSEGREVYEVQGSKVQRFNRFGLRPWADLRLGQFKSQATKIRNPQISKSEIPKSQNQKSPNLKIRNPL